MSHYSLIGLNELGSGALDLHDHGLLPVPTSAASPSPSLATPRAPIGPNDQTWVAYVPPPQYHGPRYMPSGLEQLADAAIQARPPVEVPVRAPKGAKKPRRRNPGQAVAILEEAFSRSPYISGLSPEERSELSSLTGLNVKQVQDWWRNRRGRATKSGRAAEEANDTVVAQLRSGPIQGSSSRQRSASLPPGGPQRANGTHQQAPEGDDPLLVSRLKSTFGLERDLVHVSASRLSVGSYHIETAMVPGRPIGSLAFTVSEQARCIYYTHFVHNWLERVEIPLATITSLDYTITASGDEAQIKIQLTKPATCTAALAHPNNPDPTRPIHWLECKDFSSDQITTQLSHCIYLSDPATAAQELIRAAEAVPAFLGVISISSFRVEHDKQGNKLPSALPLLDFMPSPIPPPLPYHVAAPRARMVDLGPLLAPPPQPSLVLPPMLSLPRPVLPPISSAFGPFSV